MHYYLFNLARVALPMLVLFGCGSTPNPPRWVNTSTYPTSNAEDVWATTEAVAGAAIDLDDYTIYMWPHVGGGCPAGVAECTNPEAHVLNSAWPTAAELNSTQEATNRALAGLFCHELGHVHFFEVSGDSDHNHLQTSWGYDYNTPGTVCYSVSQMFSTF